MSWYKVYLNYDQDALAMYANIGLIRRARKDIEANKITLIEQQHEAMTFAVDGQNVTLSSQGIHNASCDCPAPGHCKHIIGAVLWLQANADRLTLESQSAIDVISNDQLPSQQVRATVDVISEILSLDVKKLLKNIGKADIRLAYQLVFDWQEQNSISIQQQDGQLRFSIAESSTPIIYMAGAGFNGMISELPAKQKKAVHLALIAYLFQQHQQAWAWPEDLANTQNDIGRLSSDEMALLEQIESYIHALIHHGLFHVTHSQAKQIQLLNMSARSQGLPRLAAMLRHLCKLVELMADRHFSVDEQDILLFLAQLSGYINMLLNHQGQQLSVLRGQLKRNYQTEKQTLDLLPLGGNWWQSRTGSLGATFYFWDKKQQQYYETTIARTNRSDSNFNQHSIWDTASLWQMMPSALMTHAFTLDHPRLSVEGKLASSGSKVTLQKTSWQHQDYEQFKAKVGFNNWSELSHYLQKNTVDNTLLNEVIFIHITNFEQPKFDEVAQSLIWCVEDNQQNQLLLRIFWYGQQQKRLDLLHIFLKAGNRPLTVLVKCIRNDNCLDLEPFALLYKPSLDGDINTFSLDFNNIEQVQKDKSILSKLLARFKLSAASNTKFKPTHYMQNTLSTMIIQPLLNLLQSLTCSGRLELATYHKSRLIQLKNDCNTLGLTTLSEVLDKIGQNQQVNIDHILQAVYLCNLISRSHYELPIKLNV